MIFIEPPAHLLVKRPLDPWKPGGTNEDLGEYARKATDAHAACEIDKEAIAEFSRDYKARVQP